MDKRQKAAPPVSIFYSYAPEDEKFRQKLAKHLSSLRQRGIISEWHNQRIIAGTERTQIIDSHLNSASIILLLISPDFIASDYCYNVEMQRALERQQNGEARVIPVLLRPVHWREAPFADLQCLPRNTKPVSEWSNRDAAFREIVEGIHEAINTVSGHAGLASQQVAEQMTPVLATREGQNRQRFLKLVRNRWIKGVLEQSLHNAALIELGLRDQPDAVANPWHLVMQETDQPPRPLPPGTHITEVYDDADGALLILGEPGAGKTTLLLELARTLLERAEHDVSQPLPAIFNLSSWAEKRQPLAAWLIDELQVKYQVPRHLGTAWIETEQMLPLLDGLDEVAQEQRASCIATINQYHQEHLLVPLVICSRSAEYLAQATRAALRQAVMVQPLTEQQIDTYLSSAGEQLVAVRMALHDDANLREMATTPLMLSILTLTYQGKTLDDLTAVKSPEMRRQRVFEHYVERMLKRGRVETHYTHQQTKNWLTGLARQMKQHGQTEFYIERMQVNWLVDHRSGQLYRIGVALICMLLGGVIGGLVTGLSFGWPIGFIGGAGFALLGGLISGLNPEIRPTEAFIWSWRAVRRRWFAMLMLILAGGLVGGLDAKPGNLLVNVLSGILFGLLVGVLVSVLSGGLADVMPDTRHIIMPNQEIWRSAYHSLVITLVCILFIALFGMLNNRLGTVMVGGFGLLGALGFGGLACIEHVTLRILQWHEGTLPWRLPSFLDYATKRILLRKVGGGYIFVHRLLLEYCARVDAGSPGDLT